MDFNVVLIEMKGGRVVLLLDQFWFSKYPFRGELSFNSSLHLIEYAFVKQLQGATF